MGQGAVAGSAAPAAPKKLDAIRIVTRCTDVEQFLTMFRRFCNPTSCFIPSLSTRPVGAETAFSIRLADQTAVMRGIGVVLDAWTTAENPFGRPGVHLGIKRLAADSLETFQRLLIPGMPRGASRDTIPQPLGPLLAAKTVEMPAQPLPDEPRVPGASTILPANPLTDMNDDSLQAFVDCELREVETDESLSAGDFDFEGPLTLPNNPVIALAAQAAKEVVQRPAMRTTLGVAPLTPVKVYAAPEPVKTELVDKVDSSQTAPLATPEPVRGPWLAEFLQTWWLAVAVSLALIAIVVVAAIWSSKAESPGPQPVTTPPIASDPPARPPPPPPPSPPPATEAPAVTPPVAPEARPVKAAGGPCQLTVTTKPEGAQVKIDSKTVGEGPVTVAGPCARRRVEVSAPRWQTASKSVVVESESKVEVVLTRPKHALKVLSTPPGSTVTINGKRVGSTPTTAEVPGWTNVRIVIEKPGWKTSRQKHKSVKTKDEIYVKLAKP